MKNRKSKKVIAAAIAGVCGSQLVAAGAWALQVEQVVVIEEARAMPRRSADQTTRPLS